jgi:hypothetical protein
MVYILKCDYFTSSNEELQLTLFIPDLENYKINANFKVCYYPAINTLYFITKVWSVLTLHPHELMRPLTLASPNNISSLTIRRTVMKLKTRLRNFNTPYTGRVNF